MKLQQEIGMGLRRSLMFCRLKARVAIFGFMIILISSVLMYRALSSQLAKSRSIHSSLPTLDQKRSLRFQSKHKDFNIPLVDNLDRSFQRNVQDEENPFYANLIPKEFESMSDRDLLSTDSKEALMQFLKDLYPSNWAKAPETDEVALDLKYLLLDHGLGSSLSCKEIDSLRLGNPISYSRAKFVEYAYDTANDSGGNTYYHYDNSNNFGSGNRGNHPELAVRSPAHDLETKVACMKQIYDSQLCATMGNYRLLREVLLLGSLQHPSILLMKGYCLRGDRVATKLQEKGLVVVTEVGTPLSQAFISTSSWPLRVAMALQVGRLLQYLPSSPVGSLRFNKLDMKDFVVVKGKYLKLADLDDLEVGERSCSTESQCQIQGSSVERPCKNGVCEGLNVYINLDLAVKAVLLPLLENPPDSQDSAFVNRVANLEMPIEEIVAELQIVGSRAVSERRDSAGAPHDVSQVSNERRNIQDVREDNRVKKMKVENAAEEDNQIHVVPKESGDRFASDVLSNFLRLEQKNFAGIYDYPCPGSRVTWGCVHTVTSLKDAASICLYDPLCLSFVAFSTQPESEKLMTVVLKNQTDSTPHTSSGTTLFIKQFKSSNSDLTGDQKEPAVAVARSSADIHDCMDRMLQTQESARLTREKRLMAHLGLKGTREQAWRRSVLKQNLASHSRLVRMEGGGGKFLANLTKRNPDDPEETAKKVVFIAEDGPSAYHLAYALVYQLDRLLGLYHTPPCIAKLLTADVLDRFRGNRAWDETFQPLIESDGSLPGIIVVPTPKVMKVSKLTLAPLKLMTPVVVSFERPDKLQLEYVVLWWLVGMDKDRHDHLAYKGHHIHFYADKAFTDTQLDMSSYLHHCQFPNVVYKTLTCFRCESSDKGTKHRSSVCSLGEEVVKRTRAMFTQDIELNIHAMTEGEIIRYIDTAASSVLSIVDSCIKKFGRESVLY